MFEGNHQRAEILLVEDNGADARLIRRLIEHNARECAIHVVEDGSKALDYLMRRGSFVEAAFPDLIILDLNLPRLDSREVLRVVRGHPDLKRVPVIIFSTSNSPRDIAESYALGANAFVSKPLELDHLESAVKNLVEFWLHTVSLNERRRRCS